MNEKYLEYAREHLERELFIIDNPMVKVYEVWDEDGNYNDELEEHTYVKNPDFIRKIHDRPQYRAEIVKDLHDIKQILGR